MGFRQTGLSDERRRRVFIDERGATADRGAAAGKSRRTRGRGATGYNAAAREENMPHVTDFLPTRQFTLVMWMLAGVALVAGLLAAYGSLETWRPWLHAQGAEPFDLGRRGNLGDWFSSVLLALTALFTLSIFNVRRFKENDYRGVYRLWLTATSLLLVASVDAATGIHYTAARVMVKLTGATLHGDGQIWAAVLAGPLVLAVTARLLLEMRVCRVAALALVCAAGAYLSAFVGYTNAWHLADLRLQVMITHSSLLLGHLSLCLAAAWYARHVFLDAQGKLKQRSATVKVKAKASAGEAANQAGDETEEEDEASSEKENSQGNSGRSGEAAKTFGQSSAGSGTTLRRSDLQSTQRTTSSSSGGNDQRKAEGEPRGNLLQRMLSKTERKKLKKQQDQDSQRRAA